MNTLQQMLKEVVKDLGVKDLDEGGKPENIEKNPQHTGARGQLQCSYKPASMQL